MWYVFLWLNICSLTVRCQRAFHPYHANYINSYLYPSIYLNQLSQGKHEYTNRIKRNSNLEDQLPFLRRRFHTYVKRPDCFPSLPQLDNKRMAVIRPPQYYNVNVNQRNVRNNNAFRYSQPSLEKHYQYPSVILKKTPYTAPLYFSPPRDYNNDLQAKNNDILNYKMTRHLDDDSSPFEPEQYFLKSESASEQSTSVLDICKMLNESTTVKSFNELLLPSSIIIHNLGPWVSKSEEEVMSKNVGSLSMLYNPNGKRGTIVRESDSLIEATSESCFKYEISLINEKKGLNVSDTVNKETLQCNNEIKENITTSTLKSMVKWEEPSLDLDSIGDSTPSDISFDFEDDNICEACSHCITEETMSTTCQRATSTTTEKQENALSEFGYSVDGLDNISSLLDTKSSTIKCATKKHKHLLKTFSKKRKLKPKNLFSSSQNSLKSSFSNIKNNIGEHLGKRKPSAFEKASYSEIDKIKTLYGKQITSENPFFDELVTFNFDDYVCQCHRAKKTTNKVTHIRKYLDSNNLNSRNMKCVLGTPKLLDYAAKDYEEIRSYSRPLYESGESNHCKDGHNTYSNMADNDLFDRIHEAARTKRNTNKWFRIFPRRKRKREFVSSTDLSNNSGNSSVRLKRLHSVKRHNSVKNGKNDHRYSPKNNPKHYMNLKTRTYTGEGTILKHQKIPKDNKKREFYSCQGYGNDSCSTNSTPETILTSTYFSTDITEVTEISTTNYDISSTPKEKLSTTKPIRLVPDTGNRHPSKMACEELYHEECLCFTETAVTDLNSIVSSNSEAKTLLKELAYYKCSDYRPVKASYSLSSDLKPRLITKKHKEMLADEKGGPKEISTDTFQALLARGIPNEGVDFYIFPGTSIQVPCFSHNDIQLSPNIADSTKYDWQHDNEKSITEGRVIEDVNHKGTLQINDATTVDSGNYTCIVSYINPDTEEEIRNTFVHSVKVVTLPKLGLHTLLHYTAPVKCDQETLEMFELYLPQQIEELICSCENLGTQICTMEIHNPLCHGKNIQIMKEGPKLVSLQRTRWLRQLGVTSEEDEENRMELSLNYELDMVDVGKVLPAAVNKTRCDPFCQLKVLLKFVEILRDSLVVALSHSVNSSAGVIFEPDISTLNVKLYIACEGGLKLCQGFCIACPVHTYSEEGSTECISCPKGTYQPRLGSKSCEPCPHPFEHGCSALVVVFSKSDCNSNSCNFNCFSYHNTDHIHMFPNDSW